MRAHNDDGDEDELMETLADLGSLVSDVPPATLVTVRASVLARLLAVLEKEFDVKLIERR